jgi:hypothetical protein
MIENSLLGASAQPPDDDDIFRAETRTLLRSALFAHVEKPRGRDVAGLDFAAAAADLLDAFFALAPLTVRPSGQLQSQMAAEVGRLFVDHLLAAGSPKMSKFAKRAAQVVTRHGVEPQLARKLADGLVVGLGQFAKHCCGECPVSCLDTPEDRMSDVFFSDDHPVLGRPSR